MSLWEERAARNEALFRSVNEQVRQLAGRNYGPLEPTGFVCECADETCTERIHVALEIYEAVRANPRRFLVASGHADARIELVVDAEAEFEIVERQGDAAGIADSSDPRSC